MQKSEKGSKGSKVQRFKGSKVQNPISNGAMK
jgi:hypothetical protein